MSIAMIYLLYNYRLFINSIYILIDKNAPIVSSIRPLPGLREDGVSGHIISNSDSLIFGLKEKPLWGIDTTNSFLFSDSISYDIKIVLNNVDTVYIDSGYLDVDDYSSANINYDSIYYILNF